MKFSGRLLALASSVIGSAEVLLAKMQWSGVLASTWQEVDSYTTLFLHGGFKNSLLPSWTEVNKSTNYHIIFLWNIYIGLNIDIYDKILICWNACYSPYLLDDAMLEVDILEHGLNDDVNIFKGTVVGLSDEG